MSETPSFYSNSKFYAEEHFPYGIDRCGEFTIEQAALLIKHGKAYQALHNGVCEPINDEERKFVAVCRGEKQAVTDHEKVWMRFCEKTQKRNAISAFGGTAHLSTSDDQDADQSNVDW